MSFFKLIWAECPCDRSWSNVHYFIQSVNDLGWCTLLLPMIWRAEISSEITVINGISELSSCLFSNTGKWPPPQGSHTPDTASPTTSPLPPEHAGTHTHTHGLWTQTYETWDSRTGKTWGKRWACFDSHRCRQTDPSELDALYWHICR